jgi:erythromycin esterase-like protein
MSPSDFAAMIGRFRVLGLGESVHGLEEAFAWRAALLQALQRRTRVGALALEEPATLGVILPAGASGEAVESVVQRLHPYLFRFAAMRDLLSGLTRQAPLAIRGVDVAREGEFSHELLRRSVRVRAESTVVSYFGDVRDAAATDDWLARREAVQQRTVALPLTHLRCLRGWLRGQLQVDGGGQRRAVAAALDYLRFLHPPHEAASFNGMDLQHRNKVQARNVLSIARESGSTAFLAHNIHIVRARVDVRKAAGGPFPMPAAAGVGQILARRLGRGYRAVPMTVGSGSSRQGTFAEATSGSWDATAPTDFGSWQFVADEPSRRPLGINEQRDYILLRSNAFDHRVHVPRAQPASESRDRKP